MKNITPEIIEKAKAWLSEKYDNNTRKQVQELIDNNPDELLERSLDKEISKDNIDLNTFINIAKEVKGVLK